MLHTKQTQAFFIFCFYQVEWCCNTCTVHSLQCMGWLLFKRLHWPQRQMEVKLQGDRSGDVPIISVNYRNSHLLPCLGNTEISSDSAQWETPALPISVRCEALVHFANHLQFPWEEMCAARHKASRLLSQHDTALQSCSIPSSGTATWSALYPFLPLTCVFEDPLIRLHDGAEAVEHERAELGSRALRWLVVVQGSVCQNKPALLHLQRGHLVAALNLLMKPA